MKALIVLPLLLSVTNAVTTERYFGSTLIECNRFADLFYNTCADNDSGVISSLSDFAGETITCTGTGSCTDGGTYDASTDECTYTRKLCVSCTTYQG